MAQKTRFLRLQSLIAYLQSETDGDEIFIRYKGEKIAPADSKFYKVTEKPLDLNIEVPLDPSAQWEELELWDYDHLSPNDCLGYFRLLVDQPSDNFTAELTRKSEEPMVARYVLNWEIIERVVKEK